MITKSNDFKILGNRNNYVTLGISDFNKEVEA